MANELKVTKVLRKNRRLIDDMPYRGDLILRDQTLLTSIINSVNPYSIMPMLTNLFGDSFGVTEGQNGPMIELVHQGLPANFIRVREYSNRYVPMRVRNNSKVPTTIKANETFEFTGDQAWLDSDENFLLRDQKTFATVLSRRPGLGGQGNDTDYSVRINGIPGQVFNGSHLFEIGAPINHGYGNTQGEASQKSNTLPSGERIYTDFFNPMVIQRYKTFASGSAMSDEFFTAHVQALDGSKMEEVNTGVPVELLYKALANLERMIFFSTANFDPKTGQILGRSNNSQYPERPTYAGLFQQLDAAGKTFTTSMRSDSLTTLRHIERAVQLMNDSPWAPPTQKYIIMANGLGATKVYEALLQGGLQAAPMRITQELPADDAITTGFKLKKYVTRFGDIYLYDTSKTFQAYGEFDRVSYAGTSGSPRSMDAYIFPISSRDPKTGTVGRVAKYFSKQGQSNGYSHLNRAFVFGVSKGITGETGFTGEQLSNLQEQSFRAMIQQSNRYRLDSLTDGDEYHCLAEGVPYIDSRKVIRLRFT